MKSFRYVICLFLLLAACSVREKRAGCPCRLEIDLTCFSPFGRYAEVAIWNGPDALQETVPADILWERNLTKGLLLASAWTGRRDGQMAGTHFTVPQGREPDSLRAWSLLLDCQDEICRMTAVPRKQYTRVTLRIEGAGIPWPYQLYVESDCCGIDLEDLAPLAGSHIFPVRQAPDGTFRFDLLRHDSGTSVRLGLYEDTKREDILPLWEWFRKAGYDWEAEDLADIRFDLDYARGRVQIAIAGWEAGDCIETEL